MNTSMSWHRSHADQRGDHSEQFSFHKFNFVKFSLRVRLSPLALISLYRAVWGILQEKATVSKDVVS
jgi:hypothetical protein